MVLAGSDVGIVLSLALHCLEFGLTLSAEQTQDTVVLSLALHGNKPSD